MAANRLWSGKTMPTILFDDPQCLGSIVEGNIINSSSSYGVELNRQARVVCNRAEHILAPERYGVKMQFVIVADRNDVFERVELTPRTANPGIQLASGSRIVKRCTELAVSIVREFDNERLGFKRMGRCLRCIYTYKNREWTAEQQYERFVGNDDYFELSSVRQDAYL
jgi:hypothetical protein